MWKMVLRDYWYGFSSARKREIDRNQYFFIFWTFWLMLKVPTWILTDDIKFNLLFYTSVLPMVFSLILSRLYAGERNKTLFLCPMSRKERVKYFKAGYFLRVVPGIVLFLAAVTVRTHFYETTGQIFLSKVMIAVTYMCAVNIYCRPIKRSFEPGEGINIRQVDEYNLPGEYQVWDAVIQVAGYLLIILFEAVERMGTEGLTKLESGFLIAAPVCYVFLTWRMMRKYYQPLLCQMVDYEIKNWQRG